MRRNPSAFGPRYTQFHVAGARYLQGLGYRVVFSVDEEGNAIVFGYRQEPSAATWRTVTEAPQDEMFHVEHERDGKVSAQDVAPPTYARRGMTAEGAIRSLEMRHNPIQFTPPSFGDLFHMKGATGYSQYTDGRKSAHMASFDKDGVTQALATFLVLEGAGNLRRSTLVPTPQDKTVVVDIPGGRRFVASVTPYDDIAIKELVDAQGRPPYSHVFISWGKWVQEGKYPATDWFRSVPLKNPVWIRPEGSRRARRMEEAYDEAYDNPGRAQYAAFAQAAKAKGKTPAQIKKAYADKKAAASPAAIRRAAVAAEREIVELMESIAGAEQTSESIRTHYIFDYKNGKLDFDLPSPEYTLWKVGDPKIVKGIKAIAKKYAPKNVKISVAVSNPRY